nr:hypothetical protein B11C_70001 [Bartonella sp. 1-1C]
MAHPPDLHFAMIFLVAEMNVSGTICSNYIMKKGNKDGLRFGSNDCVFYSQCSHVFFWLLLL